MATRKKVLLFVVKRHIDLDPFCAIQTSGHDSVGVRETGKLAGNGASSFPDISCSSCPPKKLKSLQNKDDP